MSNTEIAAMLIASFRSGCAVASLRERARGSHQASTFDPVSVVTARVP